ITSLEVRQPVFDTLIRILRVTTLINLFLLGAELFTEFYTGGSHTASARYLFFGIGEQDALVPWIWTAVVLNVGAAVMFYRPNIGRQPRVLLVACLMTLVGVWI